jgi:hypothetical protein
LGQEINTLGKKKIETLKNLLDAIELQINFALENNDLASIFTPAPAEYWKRLIDDDTTDLINERGVIYFVNQNSSKSAFVQRVVSKVTSVEFGLKIRPFDTQGEGKFGQKFQTWIYWRWQYGVGDCYGSAKK